MHYHFTEEQMRTAARRKSPWNLLLIPFGLVAVFCVGFILFHMVWGFHLLLYPDHALADFGHPPKGSPMTLPTVLMILPLFPGSICAGFYLANIAVWFVGPARRAFEAEAVGHPGTDFRSAMRVLGRLTLWAVPLGLAVALTAAYFLKSLQ